MRVGGMALHSWLVVLGSSLRALPFSCLELGSVSLTLQDFFKLGPFPQGLWFLLCLSTGSILSLLVSLLKLQTLPWLPWQQSRPWRRLRGTEICEG